MRLRLLIPPLTLLAALAGVELAARALALDERTSAQLAVDGQLARPMQDGGALGLDYLPRDFRLDATGFDSHWGRCDFSAKGPRVLVLGDSTTRQVGPGPDGRFDPPELSWPMRLRERLRADVQVCVLAEDGYHPVDQAILAEQVTKLWAPDLTLALWCDNDLDDEPARRQIRDGDTVRLVLESPTLTAWAPLYWPKLFRHSEAFRFLHQQLARGRTDLVVVPNELPRTRVVTEAIRRIDALPGALRAFHLPALKPDDQIGVHRTNALADATGVPIANLPLPQPREGLRVNPVDSIHINAEGHALVARAIYPIAAAVVPPR